MLGELVVVAFTLLLGYLILLGTRKPKNFPPGPPRLPLIGSLPYISGRGRPGNSPNLLHGVLQNVEKYGSVFGFYIGREPVCVIADYGTIKEVLKLDSAAGRPCLEPFADIRQGQHTLLKRDKGMIPGIVLSYGPYWAEQKKFLHRNLRQFGFGKNSKEDPVLDVVDGFCAQLARYEGQAVDMNSMAATSVINGLWSLMVGEGLEPEDPKLKKIAWAIDELNRLQPNLKHPLLYMLPHWMLRNSLGENITKMGMVRHIHSSLMNEIVDPMLEKCANDLDAENVESFVGAYLAEVEKCSDPGSGFYRERGMVSLRNLILEILTAGADTVIQSLLWIFLMMMHHPDIKRKVHEEIDRVVGGSTPRLKHRDDMHYTNAVLMECLRMTSFAFFSIPHTARSEVKIKDYVLPAGTTIVPSLVSVHFDPEHFEEPHLFKPERFLSADGSFKHDDRAVPFSTGKRVCIGQPVAERQLFLLVVGVMWRFDLSNPPGQQLPSYHLNDFRHNMRGRNHPDFQTLITRRVRSNE